MIYGSQIWGQSINIHTEQIVKLQNRAMRIIQFEDFQANPNPIYRDNNILKLSDYIELQNCLFVYDFLNNTLPSCFQSYFLKINELHIIPVISSGWGCLFTPYLSTTRYGLHSITRNVLTAGTILPDYSNKI